MSKIKKPRKTDDSSEESEESSTSDPSTTDTSTDESETLSRKRKHKKKTKKSKKHKSKKKYQSGSEDESSSSDEDAAKKKKHKKHKKKRKHQPEHGSNSEDEVKVQKVDKVLYISSGDEDKGKSMKRYRRLEELKKLREGGASIDRPAGREMSKWDSPVDERDMDRRRPPVYRGADGNKEKFDDSRHRPDDRFGDRRRSDRRSNGDDNFYKRTDEQHRRPFENRQHRNMNAGAGWTNEHAHPDNGREYNAYRGPQGAGERFDRNRSFGDRSNNFGGNQRRPFNDNRQPRFNDNYNRRPFDNNFNDRREHDGNRGRHNPFARRMNNEGRMEYRRSLDRDQISKDRWHQDQRGDRNRSGNARRGSFNQGNRRDFGHGNEMHIRRNFDGERRFEGNRRGERDDRREERVRSRSSHRESKERSEMGSSLSRSDKPRITDRKIERKEEKNSRNRSPQSDGNRESLRDSRRKSESSPRNRSSSEHSRDHNKEQLRKPRRNEKNNESYEWGKKSDKSDENSEKPTAEKEKPNFGLSGKLTEDANKVNGVIIKYAEPPEARKPKRRWRLYPFKGEQSLQTLYIHRQSCYLIGRDRKVCDLPVDHPSCSKQHAVLQYRLVPFKRDDGSVSKRIRPYVLDMESANGTFVNNKKIEPKKYVELFEKDVVKFGFSSREYVLLHENSKEDEFDDDVALHEDPIKSEPND